MVQKLGVNVSGTRMEKSQLNSFYTLKTIVQPKAFFVGLL